MQKLGFFRSMKCKAQINALCGGKDETPTQDQSKQTTQMQQLYMKADALSIY